MINECFQALGLTVDMKQD